MIEIIMNIFCYLKEIYHFPIEQSMVIMAVIAFLYFFRYLLVPGTKRKMSGGLVVAGLLFAFYVSQVIGLTLLNRITESEARFDLNPFDVYRIAMDGNTVFMTQLICNVVMFVPLGILCPICFRRADGFFKMLLISFGCSLAIETIQLYTHTGLFEIVDLINNTLGGMIGYLLFKIFHGMMLLKKRRKSR